MGESFFVNVLKLVNKNRGTEKKNGTHGCLFVYVRAWRMHKQAFGIVTGCGMLAEPVLIHSHFLSSLLFRDLLLFIVFFSSPLLCFSLLAPNYQLSTTCNKGKQENKH